jgi:hypothetical protein
LVLRKNRKNFSKNFFVLKKKEKKTLQTLAERAEAIFNTVYKLVKEIKKIFKFLSGKVLKRLLLKKF